MELISYENIQQTVNQLPLSSLNPRQKAILKKYRKNPKSRDFLPLFFLLAELGYGPFSINFLYSRLEEHPGFSAARFVLAETLISEGNLNLAAEIIDASPVDERGNKNLQKLRLFLAFLARDQESIRRLLTELGQRKLIDTEINKVQDALTLYGIEQACEEVKLLLNQRFPHLKVWEMARGKNSGQHFHSGTSEKSDGSHSQTYVMGAADDFRVVSIDEVLPLKGMGGHGDANNKNKDVFSLNIDSVTLAEIYEKQGFFTKALKIYQRLLLATPRSPELRKKVDELAIIEKKQALTAPHLTSDVAQKVETLQNIERNISFFEDLLVRLKGV